MFTIEQIKQAHSKVKKGSDFPSYIEEIKSFGVTYYETYVGDRHTDYFDNRGVKVSSSPQSDIIPISDILNFEEFQTSLSAHQHGKTDYLKFCRDCAETGIAKWAVSLKQMTCTYFDKENNEILVEKIG